MWLTNVFRRGEKTAQALENDLTSLEKKIDDLLASFEKSERLKVEEASRKAPSPTPQNDAKGKPWKRCLIPEVVPHPGCHMDEEVNEDQRTIYAARLGELHFDYTLVLSTCRRVVSVELEDKSINIVNWYSISLSLRDMLGHQSGMRFCLQCDVGWKSSFPFSVDIQNIFRYSNDTFGHWDARNPVSISSPRPSCQVLIYPEAISQTLCFRRTLLVRTDCLSMKTSRSSYVLIS